MADREIDQIEKKLSNDKFVAKAPVEVVEEQRARKANAEEVQARLRLSLERLQSAI